MASSKLMLQVDHFNEGSSASRPSSEKPPVCNVLLEAYNATLRTGTGIATYIRNLTEAVKANGYSVDGLLHSSSRLQTKDSLLSEISFFDARNSAPTKFLANVENNWRRGIGVPLGFKAQRLTRSGMIVDSGAAALNAVTLFRNAYVARKFMDFSRLHFKRYGTAARLRLQQPPDLFHATQVIPLKVPRAANIYTIHDVVPLLLPYATLDDKKFFLSTVRYLCKKADHIVTVTEASKVDIMALTGIPEWRITNTYQAVTIPEIMRARTTNDIAITLENLFGLTYQQYFLFYGAIEPKKNVSRLISAYAASGSDFPLVIAGPLGWQYEEDLAQIERFGSLGATASKASRKRKVLRLDYLPFAHLVTLIRGARALLFPSLYEGFGLPVLEAMSLGTAVMTSKAASLAEVAGDAALLVDPLDIHAMTKAIQKIDADDDLRADLGHRGVQRAKQFSPEAYKRRIGALYRSVLGSNSIPAQEQIAAVATKSFSETAK
jgi:glycosyltransferase involved in cell wall biosynthesis